MRFFMQCHNFEVDFSNAFSICINIYNIFTHFFKFENRLSNSDFSVIYFWIYFLIYLRTEQIYDKIL